MEFQEMTTKVEQLGPKKPKAKLLSSMKKKYVNGVEVMDTELRSNVPVSQVKKETAAFVKAMDDARKMTERQTANKLAKKP